MNKYQEYINKYVDEIKETLKDELQLILIIGSSCSNEVIENWSDIDSILVLNNYDFKTIDIIKKISNSYPVKIGTTIYDKREFEEKNIDPKTIYHLYLLKKELIDIQYKCNDIKVPNIEFKDVRDSHLPYIYWRMHIYKRNFLYDALTKEQIKTIYKTTYLIMKAILILDGETPRNYRDVFTIFSTKYNYPYYDFEKFISNYTIDDNKYSDIIEYSKEFLLFIMKRF